MPKVTRSVSLDLDADRDLINYLDSLERGRVSGVIRDALRVHLEGARGIITLGDVYAAIVRIEGKLDQGVTVIAGEGSGKPDRAGDAPGTEEAAANLDKWGF